MAWLRKDWLDKIVEEHIKLMKQGKPKVDTYNSYVSQFSKKFYAEHKDLFQQEPSVYWSAFRRKQEKGWQQIGNIK